MLILNSKDVQQALPMSNAIIAMKEAFQALTDGQTIMPARALVPIEANHGLSMFMPAFVDATDQALVVKAVSLFERNPDRGLPRIQGVVLVINPTNGVPEALVEGATLTGIRTAAASGAATDILARRDATELAVLGAGVQARTHIQAMCAVRSIRTVRIYAPTRINVERLIEDMSQDETVPAELVAADSSRNAVEGADIVCCVSKSANPIFEDASIKPGMHVNTIGSYQPHTREVPAATVLRARVFVDSVEAAWEEAGDLIQPLNAGLIDRSHVLGELGQLISGSLDGRLNCEDITLFKSVGIGVQDAVAARWALESATHLGLGQRVAWN